MYFHTEYNLFSPWYLTPLNKSVILIIAACCLYALPALLEMCMIEGNAYLRNRFQFTHLLRGATYLLCHFFCMVLFQFTHLLRGATIARLLLRAMIYVSIHAPLARCDAPGATDTTKLTGFNSRTSCEVRPSESVINRLPDLFQFTHLLRGATTTHNRTSDNRSNVSIHAPLARCDVLLKYPAL